MGNSQTTATYEPPTGKTWKAYCAIDVGAVSCGYAYSFDDIKDIWVNKNWGESQGFFTLRSPSALLYDENQEPDCFGYEAIDKYLNMSREESKRVTFCYDGLLKSKLVNKATARDSVDVEAEKEVTEADNDTDHKDQSDENIEEATSSGEVVKLKSKLINKATATDSVDVEAEKEVKEADTNIDHEDQSDENIEKATSSGALGADQRQWKDKRCSIENKVDLTILIAKHCLADIEDKYSTYKSTPDEVVWVLIVPHTWELKERTIFRKKMEEGFRARFEEKVDSKQYSIAIATSVESMWLAIKDQVCEKLETGFHFRSKKKEKAVIIVHCGATKTEVTLHKKKPGAQPIKMADTLSIGGNLINRLFEEFLIESLPENGIQFVQKCKEEYLASWLDLMLQFEKARKALHYGENQDITMDINFGFAEAYSQITGKHLRKSMKKFRDQDSDEKRFSLTSSGKLYLSGVLTKLILDNLVMPITERINNLIDKKYDIRGIILTGGYGESNTLKEYIRYAQENKLMEKITLYTPAESTMLLVRGAVSSAKIKCLAENTYAIAFYDKPDKNIFLEKEEVKGLSVSPVVHKMFPVIAKGQPIEIGETHEFGPFILTAFDEFIWFDIYEIHASLKILANANKYHFLKGYDDRADINRIQVEVPKTKRNTVHSVYVKITMDRYAFQVDMTLVSSRAFEKSSVMCPYTNQITKVKHKDRPGTFENTDLKSVHEAKSELLCNTLPDLSTYPASDGSDVEADDKV